MGNGLPKKTCARSALVLGIKRPFAASLLFVFFIVSVFLSGGCATSKKMAFFPEDVEEEPTKYPEFKDFTTDSVKIIENEILAKLEKRRQALAEGKTVTDDSDQKILSEYFPDVKVDSSSNIPVTINELVHKWIIFFTEKDRERFERFVERGLEYENLVEETLRNNGVPSEIYYLALIESGYVSHAHSTMGAVGIWQFIRPTGQRYGLLIDTYVDERRDPVRATEAAAKYLRDLYNIFGSWYLAMSAYNAGEGRIMGAIRSGKSRDFWTLVEKGTLPRETSNYVPKFLAAMIIGRNLEKFGFKKPEVKAYPEVKKLSVPSPILLSDVSRILKIPSDVLIKINPHIKRKVTTPRKRNYDIWVPEYISDGWAKSQLDELSVHRISPVKIVSVAGFKVHRVKRGQTLSAIAKRYRVSISKLKRINGLRSNRIYVGQKLFLESKYRSPDKKWKVVKKRQHRKYIVKRGDNLFDISRRFGISVSKLKKINDLEVSEIQVGQLLKVPKI